MGTRFFLSNARYTTKYASVISSTILMLDIRHIAIIFSLEVEVTSGYIYSGSTMEKIGDFLS
jgi:hypothetical protein